MNSLVFLGTTQTTLFGDFASSVFPEAKFLQSVCKTAPEASSPPDLDSELEKHQELYTYKLLCRLLGCQDPSFVRFCQGLSNLSAKRWGKREGVVSLCARVLPLRVEEVFPTQAFCKWTRKSDSLHSRPYVIPFFSRVFRFLCWYPGTNIPQNGTLWQQDW